MFLDEWQWLQYWPEGIAVQEMRDQQTASKARTMEPE